MRTITVDFLSTEEGVEARFNFGISLLWRELDGFGRDATISWWGFNTVGGGYGLADAIEHTTGEIPHERLLFYLHNRATEGFSEGQWPDVLTAQLAFVELRERFEELLTRKKAIEAVGPRQPTRRKKRALVKSACEELSGPLH